MNTTTNSLDTSTSAAAQGDQVTSIRLYGSGVNPIILDSITGSTTEPLTLETFGALAQRHQAIGKNLIIARVDVAVNDANLEPNELPETRSFYYHAHSLNKILFRTFGKNGEYLFRLFALNPMTNTDMVGDVVYFMVYPGTPVHRLRPRSAATRAETVSSRALPSPSKLAHPLQPTLRVHLRRVRRRLCKRRAQHFARLRLHQVFWSCARTTFLLWKP
ncbi:hypothetical protein BCR44DRAFT_1271291 [Catenaria anguillulae PL171]|uniref:Uncharacterized protein n=1 Tax=Catenaria anguillulae PL171 TaxID=765915 RepID=A0A1Y2HZZ6_9FUNG|nr:hypothetical protein BCR44DRAFT_1271291 [Catenaria anguillulae PL171]